MKKYNLKGQLKPLNWFLENGWERRDGYVVELNTGFTLYPEEFDADLNLKEITDSICNLELEDENGTQYMRDWFEVLEER